MKIPQPRQLPSGSWYCRVRVGGQDHSITEPTEARCRARALALKTGIIEEARNPLRITLETACNRYIDDRRGVRAETTLEGYRWIVRNLFPSAMRMQLSAVNERTLSRAIQAERQRTTRLGKPVSAKSIKNGLAFVRSVLEENGVHLGHVAAPEVKRRIVQLPPPEQVIRAVRGTDVELPCLLAAWLTLSMSEIRGLTKSKSIRSGQLYVVETVVRVRGQDIRREGGKEEERTRVLTLPPYLRGLIDQVEGDVIVPMPPKQITRHFAAALERAGLPPMTFHQLRHLSASTMAMLGIQKELAQERGGWKTPYTMDAVYTHTFPEPRRQADKKIDAYFTAIIDDEKATKPKKRRIFKGFKRL